VLDANLIQASESVENSINKTRVADSFGKAVNCYDDAAGVQHLSGHKLEQWLTPCHTMMDLGCGTGFHLAALDKFSEQLVAADISLLMLEKAQQRPVANCQFIQVDAEQLSLKAPSVDAIFSNMALQWCQSLTRALNECHQVLTNDGYMLFTTLLDGTLAELKQSWAKVDENHHVNKFLSVDKVKQAISDAGFAISQHQTVAEVVEYDQAIGLLRDLKAIGANHVPGRVQRGMTRRADIKNMQHAYEQYRLANGKLPATYQVFYCKLKKA
jgi:malonyl-CoA O-methyltransferase